MGAPMPGLSRFFTKAARRIGRIATARGGPARVRVGETGAKAGAPTVTHCRIRWDMYPLAAQLIPPDAPIPARTAPLQPRRRQRGSHTGLSP